MLCPKFCVSLSSAQQGSTLDDVDITPLAETPNRDDALGVAFVEHQKSNLRRRARAFFHMLSRTHLRSRAFHSEDVRRRLQPLRGGGEKSASFHSRASAHSPAVKTPASCPPSPLFRRRRFACIVVEEDDDFFCESSRSSLTSNTRARLKHSTATT